MRQVSLIITTYNWKEALRCSLETAFLQTRLPDEIIVADDGSREDTRLMVQEMAARSPVPLLHSWQEDKGFRASMSRNKAIATARGEYIILLDGDILMEKHFIADHCACAQAGYFAQGSRTLLGQKLSDSLLRKGAVAVEKLSCFSADIENRKNTLRSPLLASLFSRTSQSFRGIKTCNYGVWKQDVVKVNGFNEEFTGWGREDSEFTVRLLNTGIQRRNIRFKALCYHLHHTMNSRESLQSNDAILANAIRTKSIWCEEGIDKYLS